MLINAGRRTIAGGFSVNRNAHWAVREVTNQAQKGDKRPNTNREEGHSPPKYWPTMRPRGKPKTIASADRWQLNSMPVLASRPEPYGSQRRRNRPENRMCKSHTNATDTRTVKLHDKNDSTWLAINTKTGRSVICAVQPDWSLT